MSTKKHDTWMPIYIGDYLADTSRLSTEQHGAYLLLLMDYWRNGPPMDDDEELASITKLSAQQWKKHAAKIRGFFSSVDGRLIQKRCDEERQKAGLVSSKRSVAGKQGAAKRWGKQDGDQIANAMANAIAEPMPDGWQNDAPSQSPSPSPISDEGQGVSPPSVAVTSEPARVVFALKPFGIVGSSSHPMLRALCEAGATVDEFTSAAPNAKGKDDPFAYVIGTVKRRREEAARAAQGLHKGAMPAPQGKAPTAAELRVFRSSPQIMDPTARARCEAFTNAGHNAPDTTNVIDMEAPNGLAIGLD